MAELKLTEHDHARVADAIREAETRTAGEIYAVFAHASGDHLGAAAIVSLLAALLAALLTLLLCRLQGWPADAAEIVLGQAALSVFLFALLAASRPLRLLFVPAGIARARARTLARAQFFAHGLHRTQGRNGILLFVSGAEHHVEIVADEALSAHVDQKEWDGIADRLALAARDGRLADGYVAAVRDAGALLARHCPPGARNPNEVPDRLVVL